MSSQSPYVVRPYLLPLNSDRPFQGVDANAAEAVFHALDRGDDVFHDELTRELVFMPRALAWTVLGLRKSPHEMDRFASEQPEAFASLVQAGVIEPTERAFRAHAYRSIEIEINRHCNLRCGFCPVATAPKGIAFMEDDLFALALRRVREYGAGSISLNHYSEPTLDPGLVQKIHAAREHRLRVRLHTNATGFTQKKLEDIAAAGNTQLIVNLPTIDKEEYERVTESRLFDRVMTNLETAHRLGIEVKLSINAPIEDRPRVVARINEVFGSKFGESVAWLTDSRAGRVDIPEYAVLRKHSGRIFDCELARFQMNISWEGKAFLCCQDFDQTYVLGDIRTQTLAEIASSDRAAEIRKWLSGYEAPPSAFICATCSHVAPLEGSPGPGVVDFPFADPSAVAQLRRIPAASEPAAQ